MSENIPGVRKIRLVDEEESLMEELMERIIFSLE